ncbi:hypothetical protein MUTS15_51240 [Escherichia coli]|nr:hypothetical protein MUTS15_51240 [Escherichia coli]
MDPELRRNRHGAGRELHVRHEGETMIAKAGDVMFIPKGSSIEFGTTSSVKFLYVAWPANWQSL